MDTISRENNSMLPVGGIIVGVIALALGAYSALALSKVNTKLAAQQDSIARIDEIANQVTAASAKSDKTATDLKAVIDQTQTGFNNVANMIGTLQATVKTLDESSKRPAHAAKGGAVSSGPVVAGPGEYIVKSGDNPHRIAVASGCTVAELLAVNPGLDPRKLKIGQKLKLPEKKP